MVRPKSHAADDTEVVPPGACAPHYLMDVRSAGARGATVDFALLFDAVPDDPAAAMRALRGKGLDGAFKAVKNVGVTLNGDFQGFIVFVAADFTLHARNIASAPASGLP